MSETEDSAGTVWTPEAFIRGQRAAVAAGDDIVMRPASRVPTRLSVHGVEVSLSDIPRGPADPRWRSLIPPPDPHPADMSPPTPAGASGDRSEPAGDSSEHSEPSGGSVSRDRTGERRILLTYGPTGDTLVVGIETPPDWELEFCVEVSAAAVREMLPVLQRLARIKNMTGVRACDDGGGYKFGRKRQKREEGT